MIDCKKIGTKIKSYMQIYSDLSAQTDKRIAAQTVKRIAAQTVKRTNDWLYHRIVGQMAKRLYAIPVNQSANQMRNYIVNGLYSQFYNHNIS